MQNKWLTALILRRCPESHKNVYYMRARLFFPEKEKMYLLQVVYRIGTFWIALIKRKLYKLKKKHYDIKKGVLWF